MMLDLQRTIVALSSGAMASRRAIVRISGPNTRSILQRLFQSTDDHALLETLAPRAAAVTCKMHWPHRSQPSLLPATAYFWPDSRSFTGEPSAELHFIGSMPIAENLVANLCALGGDMALRGEFTLRSFLAGKLDLVQAEAVLGVIEAEGTEQLHEALSQLGGNLSRPVRSMRDQLIELIAHLEAGLDFAEENIEFITLDALIVQLQQIIDQVATLIAQLTTRDARTQLAQVVIIGLPNSGKSSLFNRLVGHDRAIVSPAAGTTRDVISQLIDIGGFAFELVDTAGIEELQGDSPRAAAQSALKQRLTQADVALFCIDSSSDIDHHWRAAQMQSLAELGVSVLTVGTKAELNRSETNQSKSWQANDFNVQVSAQTGAGLATLQTLLLQKIAAHHREFQSAAMQHIAIRCRKSLAAAHATLQAAIAIAQADAGDELIAAELRIALDDLSAVIGDVHSDDILGEIFSRFCIGK